MWTLVVIVLATTGVEGGATNTSTSFLDFQTKAKCDAAAAGLSANDVAIPSYTHPRAQGIYRILTKCVER